MQRADPKANPNLGRPVPDDPREWRPQRPLETRRPLTIHDPLVEPLWSGTRVIAHVGHNADGSTVQLLDAFGVDLVAEEPELAAALATAVVAEDAILDAILTFDATRSMQGTSVVAEPKVSMLGMLTGKDAGVEIQRRDDDVGSEEAIVALDLLRLDRQSLLDVPLLERKRLLESVIEQSALVRVSVHARPPVDAWVATWKSAGLKGAILKAANSRYVPGGYSAEWRVITRVASRR
jgi:ATP-dependent DNA ligase